MPLSHDPPEFLLHKAGRRTEIGVGRTEIGRGATSRMGRIYTAATMVNGQTNGRRAKDHRQCRRYGHSKLLQKIGKKILRRRGGIILLQLELVRSTPFAMLPLVPYWEQAASLPIHEEEQLPNQEEAEE